MDNIEKAINMVKHGASVKEACRVFSIPDTSLRNHLRTAGIESSGQSAWRKNSSKKDEIRELRIQGFSYSEISKRTQVNEGSIKTWCSDIVLTDKQVKENLGVDFEKQKKAIALRKKGKYCTEIAKELDCSKSTVLSWISKYMRDTGEDLDSKARDRKKKEDSIKSGSNTINKKMVIKKYEQGFSIKEIAEDMSVGVYIIKSVIGKHGFSDHEICKIKNKANQRMRDRREKGEIKPAGGVREGSGRAKTGYYKGIYCGSTYELCWVVYAVDHNIGFSRFPDTLKHNGVTYVPDFLLDDGKTIIELKGYERENAVAKKTAVAEHHGYTVKVLRKEDLGFAFDHIKTYRVTPKDCYSLYDDHKPKYELKCCYCDREFTREKMYVKKGGGPVFCSLACSGKFRSDQNRIKGVYTKQKRKSKWSDEQIVDVFNAEGTHREIAKKFNMNLATISLIKNKKIYLEVVKDL